MEWSLVTSSGCPCGLSPAELECCREVKAGSQTEDFNSLGGDLSALFLCSYEGVNSFSLKLHTESMK